MILSSGKSDIIGKAGSLWVGPLHERAFSTSVICSESFPWVVAFLFPNISTHGLCFKTDRRGRTPSDPKVSLVKFCCWQPNCRAITVMRSFLSESQSLTQLSVSAEARAQMKREICNPTLSETSFDQHSTIACFWISIRQSHRARNFTAGILKVLPVLLVKPG
ncbi:MAG: hypothetical protein AAF722_21020, partial [Cyanobacteria bacterium P01_C01_bin.70]